MINIKISVNSEHQVVVELSFVVQRGPWSGGSGGTWSS